MHRRFVTLTTWLVTILLGACADSAQTWEPPSPSENAPTEKKRAPHDDERTPAPAPSPSPEKEQPGPGAGGPVAQVAQKFPGSKAFLPKTLPAPGLLMLHGSEGGADGSIEEDAKFFAQSGYVVVTLCWFGCNGLPNKILRVPLDRTVDAGTWLGSTTEVAGKKVGLFGWSRGAEQAVLIASVLGTKTPFATVAVHAASDTVVSSYDPTTDNAIMETRLGRSVVAPAWTFKGTPIFGEQNANELGTGPRIEIEKYPGALFVSHGMNDQLWEVARSQRLVASRGRVVGLKTEAHYWPGEGHVIETQATQDKFDAAILPFLARELGQ
jgi:dipeptidyl aminopeptidase/acylaminoacyl peptidase